MAVICIPEIRGVPAVLFIVVTLLTQSSLKDSRVYYITFRTGMNGRGESVGFVLVASARTQMT